MGLSDQELVEYTEQIAQIGQDSAEMGGKLPRGQFEDWLKQSLGQAMGGRVLSGEALRFFYDIYSIGYGIPLGWMHEGILNGQEVDYEELHATLKTAIEIGENDTSDGLDRAELVNALAGEYVKEAVLAKITKYDLKILYRLYQFGLEKGRSYRDLVAKYS